MHVSEAAQSGIAVEAQRKAAQDSKGSGNFNLFTERKSGKHRDRAVELGRP